MLAHLMTKGCFLLFVPNLLHPSSGGKAKKKSVNHTEEQLGKTRCTKLGKTTFISLCCLILEMVLDINEQEQIK